MAQMASVLQSNLMGHVPSSIAIREPEAKVNLNSQTFKLGETLEASGFMGPARARIRKSHAGLEITTH